MTTTIVPFNVSTAQSLIDAATDDRFPVDFDQAWQWAGFSSKQKAENALQVYELDGADQVFNLGLKTPSGKGGRPSKHIRMTIDAFKELCIVANTQKGKEVRRYFLDCEKALKEVYKTAPAAPIVEPNLEFLQFVETIRLAGLPVGDEALDLYLRFKGEGRPSNDLEKLPKVVKAAKSAMSEIEMIETLRRLAAKYPNQMVEGGIPVRIISQYAKRFGSSSKAIVSTLRILEKKGHGVVRELDKKRTVFVLR